MSDTFDYGEAQDDADDLIAEFGRAISLRRIVNTGTAWAPSQSSTDFATTGARVDFTLKQIQSGNILDTDERWLVAAGPLDAQGVTTITPSDLIVIGGVARSIVRADPLAPAGTAVFFDCQVRT